MIGRPLLRVRVPLRPFYHFLVASWLLCPLLATGATLHGKVIGVTDGDTLRVLDDAFVEHRVRIAGIDAPEKAQAFGNVSKAALARLVSARLVEVEWFKTDRYGRLVGKVIVGRTDVALSLVAAGYAWHFKRYETEQSERDRSLYSEAEADARSHRRGLWSDPHATAPWEFRRTHR